MAWDPARYERFKADRARPFLDLLALVRPRPAMRAVDLGCGTGEWTRRLHDHLRARDTLGIDRNAEMLARSAAFAAPGLRFERRSVEAFAEAPGGTFDLLFSNAALHWVADHPRLFARLAAALAPGGQLAVQMPLSHDDVAHATARELAGEPPFREQLASPDAYPRPLAPDEYGSLLRDLGFVETRVDVRDYVSALASREDLVEWYRGSFLTAYEERLGPQYPSFLAAYRDRLLPRLPDERPFPFRMPRLLLWARKYPEVLSPGSGWWGRWFV